MAARKRVLVTGCSGFLGASLCERLLKTDAVVYGLDRSHPANSSIHEIKDKINLITADVRDIDVLHSLLRKEQIRIIYHLAAQALVGEAAEKPRETFLDNITGTWNVLDAARAVRDDGGSIEAIVVASSDKAYGEQEQLPYVESAPLQGRFPYDVSKSCADLIAQSFFHSYQLPVCVVRCGNLYGPGDLHMSRIIPGTIMSLLNNERPLIRSDGTAVRDYIFVHDAADAYTALAHAMVTNQSIHGEAFNIGDNNPMSVLEVVCIVQKSMQREDLEPIIANTARREIQKQYLNSDKIRRCIGWTASHTFDEGLQATVAWYRHKFAGALSKTRS